MSKIIIVLALATIAAAAVQDKEPLNEQQEELIRLVEDRNWDGLHRLFVNQFRKRHDLVGLEDSDAINVPVRELRPRGPHSQVAGDSQFAYSSSTSHNGQRTSVTGGHITRNRNGHVEEYEIPPVITHDGHGQVHRYTPQVHNRGGQLADYDLPRVIQRSY